MYLLTNTGSVDTASATTIKLSKRTGCAWLTLTAIDNLTLHSQLNNSQQSAGNSVTHHIPIHVLAFDEYNVRATEPQLTAPTVKLYMPPLRKLLLVLDQMKSLGHVIVKITLSKTGEFTFTGNDTISGEYTSQHNLVDIHTVYSNLAIDQNQSYDPHDPHNHIAGDAIIRRLQSVLHCKQLSASHAIGCITQEG